MAVDAGSIPACAGEPRQSRHSRRWLRVYPRVCGGTTKSPFPPGDLSGLSPRVRGNLGQLTPFFVAEGSIPACAGEPRKEARGHGHAQVYPRVCGGTII